MKILNFMETSSGKNVTSIIIALGLACMLRIACKDANMVIIKGPPFDSTQNKIFNFDNKCYSYKTISTSCKNLEYNKSD
jgi:hypothetical protein